MYAIKKLFAAIFLSTVLLVLSAGLMLTARAEPQQLVLARFETPTQLMTPKAAIERLFTSQQIQNNWFAPAFLARVPVFQVEEIVNSLKTGLGGYQGVQENGSDYRVILDRGSVPTKIVLDNRGQIVGLLFEAPRSQAIGLKEAIEQFKALPGKVGFVVLEGNSERAGLNAEMPLAVGSAFKLAVLDALKAQIASGKRSWADAIALQPGWKSLPSGFLQNWPDGSLLTANTLAALMISQSDNTATDSLIRWVGKEAIEAISPRNRPFLTTREAFILKSAKNEQLRDRYRVGDKIKRQVVLDDVAKYSLPALNEFLSAPIALDVEWFFTARELCGLIEKVADLPLMSINPGVASPNDWERVAFKGGSEPGVFNLTTWLKAKNGKTYCVAATWNNEMPLEEARFTSLYSAVLEGLNSISDQ